MTALGMRRVTLAKRRREAEDALDLQHVIAIGWPQGPVLLVSAAARRRSEAIRKERRRADVMAGRIGADVLMEWCAFDGGRVAALRRRLASALASARVSGEMYGVDSVALASALGVEAGRCGVRLLSAAEAQAEVAARLERV